MRKKQTEIDPNRCNGDPHTHTQISWKWLYRVAEKYEERRVKHSLVVRVVLLCVGVEGIGEGSSKDLWVRRKKGEGMGMEC